MTAPMVMTASRQRTPRGWQQDLNFPQETSLADISVWILASRRTENNFLLLLNHPIRDQQLKKPEEANTPPERPRALGGPERTGRQWSPPSPLRCRSSQDGYNQRREVPSLDAQDTEGSIGLTMITAGFWTSGWQPPHGSPPHSPYGAR